MHMQRPQVKAQQGFPEEELEEGSCREARRRRTHHGDPERRGAGVVGDGGGHVLVGQRGRLDGLAQADVHPAGAAVERQAVPRHRAPRRQQELRTTPHSRRNQPLSWPCVCCLVLHCHVVFP